MLISAGKISCTAEHTENLSTSGCDIYWQGFVYRNGCCAGAPSLDELAKAPEAEIPRHAAQLKGAYCIAILCKRSNNCYMFVDPGGFFHAYYSSTAAGTSFLELSRAENCTAEDIDPESLVEFFHLGCVYEERTLFRQIRKVDPFSVICSNPLGSVEQLPKPLPDISEPPRESFDALMQDFVLALRNERVSVDITGGVDSRLLATALCYFGLPFEMAASGRPGIPDLKIAAKVARALGRPFYPTYHSAERCDWDELFCLSDGMFDVSKNSRQIQLQKERKKRGISLSVSGAGGELYKDFWWLQDFPFYSRPEPRIERLYSMRIASHGLQHYLLGDRYRLISEWYPKHILDRLWEYAVPGNTKTYDRIYYYFKLRGYAGRFITSSLRVLRVGMPYLDTDAVRIGYNLPRSQRFFNRFHRRKITQYSPKVSKLPTTEGGMSTSSGAFSVSKDFARYVVDRCQRLTKKVGQRVLGKTLFQGNSDDPAMADELMGAMVRRKTTQILADHGVLQFALNPRELPTRYLGSTFALGRFFEELDRSRTSPAATTERATAAVGQALQSTQSSST